MRGGIQVIFNNLQMFMVWVSTRSKVAVLAGAYIFAAAPGAEAWPARGEPLRNARQPAVRESQGAPAGLSPPAASGERPGAA